MPRKGFVVDGRTMTREEIEGVRAGAKAPGA